jgi:hypothetical protein
MGTARCRIDDDLLLHMRYSRGFCVGDSAPQQRRLLPAHNNGGHSVGESPDRGSPWPNNQLNHTKYGAQH